MTHFESFDNLEDMLTEIQLRAERAMQNLHPLQRTFRAGMHAVVPRYDLGLLIFGTTFTDEETIQGEVESGASEEEAKHTARRLADAQKKGYYFGRWYSPALPEGEYGDQHLSRMWPISKIWFDVAKVNQWKLPTDALVAMFDDILSDDMKGGDDE